MRSTVNRIVFLLALLVTVTVPPMARAGAKAEARKHASAPHAGGWGRLRWHPCGRDLVMLLNEHS